MLVEIYCPEFKERGVVRSPIVFHNGLNVIVGTDDGKNSIGKSTILMIIDFAFGGEDYVKKSTDVINEVGSHSIYFTFSFRGEKFRFSRHTAHFNEVHTCNERYESIGRMSLEEYKNFLASKYGIATLDMTFRNAIGCFFRIYHRDVLDRNQPLKAASRQSDKDGLNVIFKLMNRYKYIADAQNALDDAKNHEIAFKQADKYGFLTRARNQKEYDANEKKIEELRKSQKELTTQSEKGYADIDSIKADRVSILRHEIAQNNRRISDCEYVLSAMRMDKSATSRKFANDFSELLKFFPNTNLRKLQEIETFHEKLLIVLTNEFKSQEESMNNIIRVSNTRIAELESELDKVSAETNLTKTVLDQYASLENQIRFLDSSNRKFIEYNKMTKEVKEYSEAYEAQKETQRQYIETILNQELSKLNDFVCNGHKTAPYVSLENNSRLSLKVEKDQGTGAEDRGLILFDIAMLNLTSIPAITHDTILLKSIEDDQILGILNLYAQSKKQVFIAFDKAKQYKSAQVDKIITDNAVMTLYGDGGELFGRSWSSKEENGANE